MQRFSKMLPVLALLAACHDRPQVIAVQGGNDPASRPGQMTVTGLAKLDVSPDCADLTMTISDEDASPAIATRDAQAKEDAVVAKLRELGVGDRDLKLSSLALEPEYQPDTQSWQPWKLRGYRAQITITATTHDFAKIPTLMEAGAQAGVTNMSSQFRRSDLDQLKKKVRDMAIAAAKDKADQTAHDLGIHLGRVISVSESQGGTMWNQEYFPQAANVQQTSNGGGSLGGTLQPLTLEITIGYELAQQT
jgi:uncharacterized protein YggE